MATSASGPDGRNKTPVILDVPIDDIGVLPTVVTRVNELANDPSTDADRVARLILRDPSLTSKVLRIINSAFYGLRQQVQSIQHAVAYLGIHQVRNIVWSSALIESFRFAHGVVEPGTVWEHSLGCAIGAKRMGDLLPEVDGDGAYLGGLLHDLGRIVLLSRFPDSYREVIQVCERGLCTLREAETGEFGISHEEVGASVGEGWDFQEAVIAMIRHHHDPQAAGFYTAPAAVISFVDAICHEQGLRFGFAFDDDTSGYDKDEAWAALRVGHPDLSGVEQENIEAEVVDSIRLTKSFVAGIF
jgi:putative nucleotidyltransferase with HDIG domain